MTRISKRIAVITALAAYCIFSAGICTAQTPRNGDKSAEQKEVRIVVEAFVVEVKLAVLYESGADILSDSPNPVTMTKLLWCLSDENNAKVTGTAKVIAENGRSGSMSVSEKEFIPLKKTVTQAEGVPYELTEYCWVENSIHFETNARIEGDGKIKVEFALSQRTPGSVFLRKKGILKEATRQWESNIQLDPGKPRIVSSSQNEDIAVFLILCADY